MKHVKGSRRNISQDIFYSRPVFDQGECALGRALAHGMGANKPGCYWGLRFGYQFGGPAGGRLVVAEDHGMHVHGHLQAHLL
jgi:hypothetical protein